jgi:hypothetical protein
VRIDNAYSSQAQVTIPVLPMTIAKMMSILSAEIGNAKLYLVQQETIAQQITIAKMMST